MVLVTQRNKRRLRWGDQRELFRIKIDITRSKDKLFFIDHMTLELTHTKWYLVQVDMDQTYPVTMRDYGV